MSPHRVDPALSGSKPLVGPALAHTAPPVATRPTSCQTCSRCAMEPGSGGQWRRRIPYLMQDSACSAAPRALRALTRLCPAQTLTPFRSAAASRLLATEGPPGLAGPKSRTIWQGLGGAANELRRRSRAPSKPYSWHCLGERAWRQSRRWRPRLHPGRRT